MRSKAIVSTKLVIVLGILLILLSACSLFKGRSRSIGLIELSGEPVQVQVPKEVERGQEFQVSVTTYGGGCTEKGETNVDTNNLEATITPYDYEETGVRTTCNTIILFHEHVGSVRFERTGTATVIIRGRSEPEGGVITVERTVNVR